MATRSKLGRFPCVSNADRFANVGLGTLLSKFNHVYTAFQLEAGGVATAKEHRERKGEFTSLPFLCSLCSFAVNYLV